MVDESQIEIPGAEEPAFETPPPSEEESAVPEGAKKSFLSATTGKLIVIGGSLALLLVFLLVVVFIVFTFVVGRGAEQVVEELEGQLTVPPASAPQAEESAEGAEPVAEPDPFEHDVVGVDALHTWRNIFQPLLTPVDETDETTDTADSSSTSDETSTQYDADTLYLLDILSGGGETAAQFYYNGIAHNTSSQFTSDDWIVVLEGDRLADTPWRLLSIGVTSVTLQYGDSTVSLSIGQGIAK